MRFSDAAGAAARTKEVDCFALSVSLAIVFSFFFLFILHLCHTSGYRNHISEGYYVNVCLKCYLFLIKT